MDTESPMITDYVGPDSQPGVKYNFKERDAVRTFGFLGGCSLIGVSLLSAVNVFAILTPSVYLLNLFQCAFGLCVMVVEGKNYESLQKYYAQVEAYARFLTLPHTKGVFYLFLVVSFALTGLSFLYVLEGFLWAILGLVLLLFSN